MKKTIISILGSAIIGITTAGTNGIIKTNDTKEIQYKGNIIEVKKDVYKEITEGENSNLKGDLYIESKDIISVKENTKDINNNSKIENTLQAQPKEESKNVINTEEPKTEIKEIVKEEPQKEQTIQALPNDYKSPIERYKETDFSQTVKDAIISNTDNFDGDKIYILNDNSTILINEEKGEYLFYPSCIGDYNYTMDNLGQLNMIIETYLEINPKIKGSKIEITNTFTKDNGDVITEYNNGSYSLINENTKEYYFQPSQLGDWDLKCNTLDDLNGVIYTYSDIMQNTIN